MSLTVCRTCNSTNVRYCCGRETDFDEFFEPLEKAPDPVLREFEEYWARLRAQPVEESIFQKMDRLSLEIEGLGWDIFILSKSPEMTARAISLGKIQQQKETELKALIAERRKCL